MRCGRNNPTHNSNFSIKPDKCLEIIHLIDVLRCGNRSISGIIDFSPLNYKKNNAHPKCVGATPLRIVSASPPQVSFFF